MPLLVGQYASIGLSFGYSLFYTVGGNCELPDYYLESGQSAGHIGDLSQFSWQNVSG